MGQGSTMAVVTRSTAVQLDCSVASCRVDTVLGQQVGVPLVGVASDEHADAR